MDYNKGMSPRWMRNIKSSLLNLPITKKMGLIIASLSTVTIVALVTCLVSVNVLSGLRAYVGGESLWSKGQKDANYYLWKFVVSKDEQDYEKFKEFSQVPLSDREARLEMLREDFDYKIAKQGLVEGKNHPHDVWIMVLIFRHFAWVPHVARARDVWRRGDAKLLEQIEIAEKIYEVVRSNPSDQAKLKALLDELDKNNLEVTALEDEFSYVLGDASRIAANLLMYFTLLLIFLFIVVVYLVTKAASKVVTERIENLNRAVKQVGEGNYNFDIPVDSKDEIGTLAENFKIMAEKRKEAEDYIKCKADELKDGYEKLLEANKLKEAFLANVSHELRTPLTILLAGIEQNIEDLERDPKESKRLKSLKRMHNNAIRLLQMVTSLLDFSKLESGKMTEDKEHTYVYMLAESIFSDFKLMMAQKKIQGHFECNIAKNKAHNIDRYMFDRILFNLLSNAVKFTPAQGKVTLKIDETNGMLFIKVIDNGIGIFKNELETLFDAFHQVEDYKTKKYEGTGLGLALVKKFATTMGGNVEVDSHVGKGSTFTVWFPVESFSRENLKVNDLVEFRNRSEKYFVNEKVDKLDLLDDSKPSILIVEDNLDIAHQLYELLSDVANLRVTYDGETGWKLYKELKPDLIISDVMLPLLGGLDFCRKVKNEPDNKTNFVLLTALSHRDAISSGWKAGADDYITKPFHPVELVSRVTSLIEQNFFRKKSMEQLSENEKKLKRLNEEVDSVVCLAIKEVKDPLTRIKSIAQKYTGTKSNVNAQALNEEIMEVIEECDKVINQVQNLLSYFEDEPNIRFEDVSLNEIINRVQINSRGRFVSSNIHFLVGKLPIVLGDSSKLVTIFENLFDFFFRLGRENEINISIMSAKLKEQSLTVEITVDGLSLSEELTNEIFTPYKKLDSLENMDVGISLAICRKYIEAMKGEIAVQSNTSESTCFTIELPVPNETLIGNALQ